MEELEISIPPPKIFSDQEVITTNTKEASHLPPKILDDALRKAMLKKKEENKRLRDQCREFLYNERVAYFKVHPSFKLGPSDVEYQKVYDEQGHLLDTKYETDDDLDDRKEVCAVNNITTLRDDFNRVQVIRQNVDGIRKKMEDNESQTRSTYLIELLQEMRKLNTLFSESFNPELLALQQKTLIEIQECLTCAKTN